MRWLPAVGMCLLLVGSARAADPQHDGTVVWSLEFNQASDLAACTTYFYNGLKGATEEREVKLEIVDGAMRMSCTMPDDPRGHHNYGAVTIGVAKADAHAETHCTALQGENPEADIWEWKLDEAGKTAGVSPGLPYGRSEEAGQAAAGSHARSRTVSTQGG